MDLNAIQNVAIGAAYAGAGVLSGYFGSTGGVHKKGPNDLVTDADLESQQQIVAAIREKYPDHAVMAEEEGLHSEESTRCQWIIDPLDGTTNFAHGIPIFAVSIAFAHENTTRVGVVLNPISGELFTAVEGRGAAVNNSTAAVSPESEISESLLVTGFPYDFQPIVQTVMERFQKCLLSARGIRRLGAAALDLCYVACGRFEGFWEQGLKPWDTAAGALIVREAGGRVTDFSGNPHNPDKNEILATNGRIHDTICSLLKAG